MNCRVQQKFRKFLHQLKNKEIYRYDVLFTDCVSQFVRYDYQLMFSPLNPTRCINILSLPLRPSILLLSCSFANNSDVFPSLSTSSPRPGTAVSADLAAYKGSAKCTSTLQLVAAGCFETSVSNYQYWRCHISDNVIFSSQNCRHSVTNRAVAEHRPCNERITDRRK